VSPPAARAPDGDPASLEGDTEESATRHRRSNAPPGVTLFVYGSLLSGESNHARLAGTRRIGTARTTADYDLVDLGHYPALLEAGATAVHGELYEVDLSTLAILDEFEGHPSLYRRTTLRLEGGAHAEGYVLEAKGLAHKDRIILDGDWRRHRATRPWPRSGPAGER
jgi:gamma-glutamylaminecyclotransferase